jgi:hypothetical protein
MLTLQIPPGVKTLELTNSIVWFDDKGILYSRPTPGPFVNATMQQMESDLHKLKDFTGGKKVFMIAETHPQAESPKKEDRDYIDEKLHELIKALAIITPNAVSRMVTNLFFLFKPPSFPTKMFVSVSDARKWLETCLTRGPGPMVLS